MIPDLIQKRLVKDRPMTSITLRIPVNVVESIRNEAKYTFAPTQHLVQALKKRGVPGRGARSGSTRSGGVTRSGSAAPAITIGRAVEPAQAYVMKCLDSAIPWPW